MSDLIDTLLSLHSISLPLTHLETALTQISTYYQRFKNRLKPVHALHLKQCGSVIRGLINASKDWAAEGGTMDGKAQTNKNKEQLFKVNDLMGRLTGGADQVNLVELVGYLKESQLARKISGYAEKTAKDETKAGTSYSQTVVSRFRANIARIIRQTRSLLHQHHRFPPSRVVPYVPHRRQRRRPNPPLQPDRQQGRPRPERDYATVYPLESGGALFERCERGEECDFGGRDDGSGEYRTVSTLTTG